MIRKWRYQNESPTLKTETGDILIDNQGYLYKENISGKPSDQLFPNWWPLSYISSYDRSLKFRNAFEETLVSIINGAK